MGKWFRILTAARFAIISWTPQAARKNLYITLGDLKLRSIVYQTGVGRIN